MSVSEFTAALDGARTLARVDDLARALWAAYGAGEIDEGDAEGVAARIEDARRRIRPLDTVRAQTPGVPLAAVSRFPPRRRRCVSPERLKARERRRKLAYSGPLPSALAARFTPGQLATLRVVADEARACGSCTLTLCEIAARAGVCVTLARDAIRLAAGDGLAVIVERRRPGRPNLPNVVRIVSREWLAWIWRGSKKVNPTDIKDLKPTIGGAATKEQPKKRRAGEGGAQWHGGDGPSGRQAASARLAMSKG